MKYRKVHLINGVITNIQDTDELTVGDAKYQCDSCSIVYTIDMSQCNLLKKRNQLKCVQCEEDLHIIDNNYTPSVAPSFKVNYIHNIGIDERYLDPTLAPTLTKKWHELDGGMQEWQDIHHTKELPIDPLTNIGS